MKRTFTIHTDASFHPQTGIAAWAYWIEDGSIVINESGLFGTKLANSSVAELLAIEKAIRRVDNLTTDRKQTRLRIHTDSMWTIDALSGTISSSKQFWLIKAINHSMKDYEVTLTHIRSHQHTDDKEHWINDVCDKQAKKLVREELGK